ncbi:MAG: glycerol kinase GlpK, partial [Betaproteobacteria bacterium]|nr:glycerol kinase GlpK [Betaproteobacteria bacterium]
MKAIVALDQGTTSCRALVFDRHGRILAVAQREFAQYFPQPGWVEHDAEEIWQNQRETTALALSRANLLPSDIAAIGITNQRETTVLWDRLTGKALAPAIVWQDRRTAAACDALVAAGKNAAIQQKTGLVVDAYFSGTKLQWLLDHVPGARKRAEQGELAFGTIDSWLVWQLTAGKVHATDASNASRTMLCNIHSVDWDEELLGWLDIPRSVLPQIVSSSEVVGHTACAGLPPGIPIGGIAGDQQAALFGQACHRPGMAKNTYGTGCFMLMNTGTQAVRSQNRLLTTIAWRMAGETHYALEGSVFAAGAAVQWLRDGLGIIARSSDTESLAVSVADSGGVFLVPAFAGLGA